MNREGVGLADAQEAPELKKLWRLSFPEDTEEGVAFFFQRVFQPLIALVFRQEGRRFPWLFCFRPCCIRRRDRLRFITFTRRLPGGQTGGAAFSPGAVRNLPGGKGARGGGLLPPAGGAGTGRLLCPVRLPSLFSDRHRGERGKKEGKRAFLFDGRWGICPSAGTGICPTGNGGWNGPPTCWPMRWTRR